MAELAADRNELNVIAWLERRDPKLASQVVPEIRRRMMRALEEYEYEILGVLEDDEADDHGGEDSTDQVIE